MRLIPVHFLVATCVLCCTESICAQRFGALEGAIFATTNTAGAVVRSGDLSGDGVADLVVAGKPDFFTPGTIELYLGDGDGLFSRASPALPVVRGDFRGLHLVDVDGDGDLDIIGFGSWNPASTRESVFLRNDGKAVFRDDTRLLPKLGGGPVSSAFADVDGDRDLDCVLGGSPFPTPTKSTIWSNDGTGVFTARSAPWKANWIKDELRLADVDADGDVDVLVFDAPNLAPRVMLGDGRGGFTESPSSWPSRAIVRRPVLVDFDRDGDIDVLDTGGASSVGPVGTVYRNTRGVFRADSAVSLPWFPFVGEVATGDLDRDGFSDVVLFRNGQGAQVLRNGGGKGFAVDADWFGRQQLWLVGGHFVDVDADRDLDLVAVTGNAFVPGAVGVMRNLRRQIVVSLRAAIGQRFTFAAIARDPAIRVLGYLQVVSPRRLSRFADLGTVGMLGLDPVGSFVLPPITVVSPMSLAAVSLRIPMDTRLRGTSLWFQSWIAPDAGLSNVTRLQIR